MYALYGNIYHQYTPVMLVYIYHTYGSYGIGALAYFLDVLGLPFGRSHVTSMVESAGHPDTSAIHPYFFSC